MAGEKILVVDDHKEMVDLIEESFKLRGFDVVGVCSGHEALAKVYQEKPDLILLDVMMPLLDGYEICHTLKSNEETRHIPVILITVKGSQADIERGFEVRADGYVVKPFEPSELTEFAEKFLQTAKEQV
ncbi:response regulator [candidate division FCPU426 bacterium]|nr:response regulator [candidate division FCPU426 bacterium]